MRKTLRTLLWQPFYPWLVGAFPVLHLYAANFDQVIDREVAICLFLVLAATTTCYFASYTIQRNRYTPALITSAVSVCFSLSGHIHSLIFDRVSILLWTLVVATVCAAVVVMLRKAGAHVAYAQVTPPLNLVFLALILMQIVTLFAHYVDSFANPLPGSTSAAADQASRPKVHDSATRPDIYFIIPDGYPSDAWMQRTMNFDNSAFTEALKARGFIVAPHAQSNYAGTLASVASMLNMRHVNENPSESGDVDYLRLAISDNEVARYLKRHGYTYIQLLSGYFFPSPLADINRDFAPDGPVEVSIDGSNLSVALSDTLRTGRTETDLRRFFQRSFASLYIETTLLKVFADRWREQLQGEHSWSYDMYSPYRFLDTVDAIDTVVAMPEATFTFVHLLKPHRPVVFDEFGNIIPKITKPSAEEHISELKFVNSKFIEMIDTILEDSKQPPVIIFQADHGSTNGAIRGSGYRLIHFDVYSAYYLPARYALVIPRPHTTVNTFPLILNAVFDAGLEFSANRLFEVSKIRGDPLDQEDVTETFANWLK